MYILERLNVQKKTESEYIKQKLINMGFQVIGEECTKNEEQQNIAELLQVENEKLKTELPYDLVIPLLGIYPKTFYIPS